MRLRTLVHALLATAPLAACGSVADLDAPRRADDAGADAALDPDAAAPDADIVQPCVTGVVDADPRFCCADPNNCPSGGSGDGCALDCAALCAAFVPNSAGFGFEWCGWTSDPTPRMSYTCGACGVGRVAAGAAACPEGDTIAARLAFQAYYEAVSVTAFEELAAALVAAGAPSSLIARARQAADEERAHAARFAAEARARGEEVPLALAPRAARSLAALALENAVEGCVRETYGALVAGHQARHAEDALRPAFAAIADDELGHAELSWELHRWFCAVLPREEAASVEAAFEAARAAFREELAGRRDPLAGPLGVPEGATALRLYDGLFDALAAAA